MNEYNHHRIIGRFVSDNQAQKNKLPSNIKDIFEKASDFTDSVNAEGKYYFYHFYYDIQISGTDTINLSRVDEETNRSAQSMSRCGNLVPGSNPPSYIMRYSSKTDEKEFFSFINDRPRSPRHDVLDIGNQSDNVAFLHAMGAELGKNVSEKPAKSRSLFEEHLTKCFAEYLFVKDNNKALFMLGIAFHGIMDSFTPSHMDFQHYTKQDMALHAQGDVIPIQDSEEIVHFVPGQFDKDNKGGQLLSVVLKGFDNNTIIGDLNIIEYEMLRIYLNICKFKLKGTEIESSINDNDYSNMCGEYPVVNTSSGNFINVNDMWKSFKGKTCQQINDELSKYEYAPEAYIYSDTAIETIKKIYLYLSKERKKCKEYQYYKENKKKILYNALQEWKEQYDKIGNIRKEHIKLDFYSDKGLTRFDSVAGVVKRSIESQARIIEENQKIIPNFNLYHNPGGGKI